MYKLACRSIRRTAESKLIPRRLVQTGAFLVISYWYGQICVQIIGAIKVNQEAGAFLTSSGHSQPDTRAEKCTRTHPCSLTVLHYRQTMAGMLIAVMIAHETRSKWCYILHLADYRRYLSCCRRTTLWTQITYPSSHSTLPHFPLRILCVHMRLWVQKHISYYLLTAV